MLIAIFVFLLFLLFGMPVAFAIGISGMFSFNNSGAAIIYCCSKNCCFNSKLYSSCNSPFVFAGNLMNNTGITKRLIKLANALTGHMYGNLAQVSCVLSTLMGGVSGSANADAAMETRILGPSMTKRGYSPGYSAAINGVTSLITCTIPPSMGLIIYGSVGKCPLAVCLLQA